MMSALDVKWRLTSKDVRAWCHEVDNDPRYSALDIPYEITRCSEHWQGKRNGRFPASWSVHARIRRWLDNQVKWAGAENGKPEPRRRLTRAELRALED